MTRDEAVLAERKAIVDWLQRVEAIRYARRGFKDEAYTCLMAAYDIERGEHIDRDAAQCSADLNGSRP